MTDINFYSESEPDYVKKVIPISFYEQDLLWMDPEPETVNFWLPAEYGEESEFVKMTIPISAYTRDNHHSHEHFEIDSFMPIIGSPDSTGTSNPGQTGAIM